MLIWLRPLTSRLVPPHGGTRSKNKFLLLLAVVILLPLFASAQDTPRESGIVIDDFQTSAVGKFPSKWRTWPFQREKAAQVYQIAEEGGRRILKANEDKELSTEIMRYFNWEIGKYPYLSWQWKARTLPTGAQENDDNKNDSACGIYVIVGGYTGNALKYVWSTSLPVGQTVTRRDGKLKIKVTDSGKANLNKWQRHTVSIPIDYKELFGDELKKNPSGVGILTDGNATHSAAACDYADFTISKEPMK